jgi:hypothetical protein
MSWSSRLAGLSLVLAGMAACKQEPAGPPAPVPTSLLLSTNAVSFSSIGASQQISATVRDQNNQPISGLAATFVTSDAAVASVTTGGLITAVANGSATITVSHEALPTQQIAVAVSQVVAELAKIAGDGQTGVIGGQLSTPVEVELRDGRGNVVPGGAVPNTTVQFVASNGGSVSAGLVMAGVNGRASTLWTLGPGAGNQQLTASIQGGSASTMFAATAAVTSPPFVKFEGDGQLGLVGTAINIVPAVKVQNEAGVGIPGTSVTFTVTGGGGSVTGGSVTTDAQGIARPTNWTLGASAGANTIEATSGVFTPLTFTATGHVAAYDLEIRYLAGTTPTAGQQAAFDAAVARWEGVLFRDLAAVPVNVPANACISGQPALNETIDDMIVFVQFAAIDGPGGVLAQAGRCDIAPPNPPLRGSTDSLPALGILRIDSGDLASQESAGTLDEVITHELGHTLGFAGDFFALKGRMVNPSLPSSAGVDTHFNGVTAINRMNAVGGVNYAGAKVPLDNTAIPGSADSHWRESVFTSELMTPIATGSLEFSAVTAAAMVDLGYGATFSGVQSFSLGAAPGALRGPIIVIRDEVIFRPLPPSVAARRQ